MTELAKTFEPSPIEAKWYAHWEGEGLFRPERPDATPYTIVMPPPNVTGSLHIGHALDNTLQDILIRRARMEGKDSLWVVGTDHAGIATQMVVERNLDSQGIKRADIGRDAFLEHVWEWKAQSGGAITRQLRRLGASCDWANERFTMDEGFSKAVTKVFVELHRRGLLYRDKRLVNWDPKFQTAISDLEVETREVAGKFWTLRYPFADGSGAIEVATTRPETMLADMAVAVHPDDARYTAKIGQMLKQPLTGRLIPVIADEHADPELGSGAVKITPGHDFNDYEVGKRAGFKPADMLNMLSADAKVCQTSDGLVPADLIGMDRFDARKEVVARLEAEGALVKVEDRTIATPYGDRSGAVIEPWLTDQWYVDAATLAKKPLEAVRSGDIAVVPETWKKTWYNWLENIQPWCVSRQLWWGHRIPAWAGPRIDHIDDIGQMLVPLNEHEWFVAESAEEAGAQAVAFYNRLFESKGFSGRLKKFEILDQKGPKGPGILPDGTVTLLQEEAVLDTWFSSALWPFGTLGWPDDATEETLPLDGGGVSGLELPGAVLPDSGGGDVSADSSGLGNHPTPTPPHRGEGIRKWTPKPGSDLARHYPNDVLISGFDILFFWDARMAMQGFEFMGERPWKTLYLHGLVRDDKGAKMSKSKGNVVDPLGLIDKYGADALRFTLAAMESQGRDIKLDEKRVEGYRNFATKLWNAARFLQGNGVGASSSIAAPEAKLPVNRWIIGEVVETLAKLNKAFDELRFDGMADAIYHFTWGTFCDLYVEDIKGNFDGETKAVAAWAFDQILVMLHPFMPFVTEELWHAMGKRPHDLIVAKWPNPEARVDQIAAGEMGLLHTANAEFWSVRSDIGIPPSAKLKVWAYPENESAEEILVMQRDNLRRRARLESIDIPDRYPNQTLTAEGATINLVAGNVRFVVDVGAHGDIDAYRSRLVRALEAAEKERDSLAARLGNANFTERAKPEAVEKARADHDARAAEAERLSAALARLG